ncbi:MAG: ABC transporter substrate-binding protein [Armatimonadota bacterium]|nr:ABC transporter substrate-binding protein [Armatimonadota bacterium]MDR7518993.1 ABC transporter substrate-binding protein [Armatimonadota bacterium]MDR7548888.1 ABC transporter substrate-binding protein [Armatimonadota bacterium]
MTRWAAHVVIATAVALALIAGLASTNFAQGRPVTIAITGDAETMDPMLSAISTTFSVQRHIMEPLVDNDPDARVVPVLATSWRALDTLTWEFKLRPGVRFHNGEPFNAESVKFSIERSRDHARSLLKAYVSLIKEVRIVDDLTVRLVTSEPSPDLVANLANNVYMLPPRHAREVGDEGLARRPVGTGPYRFVEWVRDDRIVLEANPTYWGPKPQATRVTIKPIPEGATRVAALLAGEVDVIESVPIPDIPRVTRSGGYRVLRKQGPRLIFLAMDVHRDRGGRHPAGSPGLPEGAPNPFKDVRVRQAIYHAVNTKEIVEQVMGGAATPAEQILPPFMFGYNPKVRRPIYDPSRAKRLLAEAGYPNGFSVRLDVTTDRYVNDREVGLALVGMLKRVGIDVTLNGMPRLIYFPRMRAFDTSFQMSGWLTLISSSNWAALLGCVDPKTGYGRANYGRYCNPELDRLIDIMRTEMDEKKRLEAFHKAAELTRQDVGKIPLYFEELTRGVKAGIEMPVRVDEYVLAADIKFR